MPRAEHGVSRDDISDNALKVLYRLHNAGYQAYLVGGCVRDILLGHKPKDFDVTTNAEPEQVKELFRNCRLIGRRFRLAHIMFGREIIEVATFRGHHQEEGKLSQQSDHGQILRDNVFGSIQEDAERRDFTINAMYYNIADFSISDFADGIGAIAAREIAMIGDPKVRFKEDPVRMLRAVRFAVKLDMHIAEATAKPIKELSSLLNNIPAARLFEEVLKLFMAGKAFDTLNMLQQYHLLEPLFPRLSQMLREANSKEAAFIEQVMRNTDERINNDQRVTPAFIYAALMWYPLEERCHTLMTEGGLNHFDAYNIAIGDILGEQTKRIMIPKRFTTVIRDIWQLQQRLPKRFGRRAYQMLDHPKFRAAYDFLLVRAHAEGGDLQELADWWTEFQEASVEERKTMVDKLRDTEGGPKRKRRFRSKKKA
ncbi:polynucleotide adenylyltransferase PcnB [Alteromonadaceae bacterium BrNp21-10]|nr:polynucleotide adenylyltransferase PcnB [Alteromonadaceae bacterium BrNp21-10]